MASFTCLRCHRPVFIRTAGDKLVPENLQVCYECDVASRHLTPGDGNVFTDIGFSPEHAAALLAAADAHIRS
jgi:hypothetical protein